MQKAYWSHTSHVIESWEKSSFWNKKKIIDVKSKEFVLLFFQ